MTDRVTPQPWHVLGPLALAGGSGGALWLILTRGALSLGEADLLGLLYAWWFPGLLVGLTFAATLRLDPHRALAFATVTGGVFCAGIAVALSVRRLSPPAIPIPFSWEGAISGLTTAWLFHRAGALFLFAKPRGGGGGVAVVLGAVLGGILANLLESPVAEPSAIIATSSAWTASVGFASYNAILKAPPADHPRGSMTARLREALLAPATQFLGLVVTLMSVISLFWVLT